MNANHYKFIISKKKLIILLLIIISLHTSNCFSQWMLQQSGVTSPLEDIEFIDRNTGWACGNSGVVLKTTNGGTNWTTQITNVPNKHILGIHPVNDNVVYAVGYYGTILKTTNGGNEWIAIENEPIGEGGDYFSVFFLNENTGWIGENNVMGQGDVKKTTNGGITFISAFTNGWPRDMYFKDSLNGVGVDGATVIHKTTNGGDNWLSFAITGAGDFYRVSFINNYTGFTVANGTNLVYKTTDFGTSWNEVGIVEGVVESLYSVRFKSDSIGWVGGTSYIWKTINGGANWRRENLSAGYFISISALNDSVVWACGNPGRIWHTTNGGQPFVGIQTLSSNIPGRFELEQNYPNPFNSTTSINFSLNNSTYIKLTVYDILGNEIKSLVNEKLNSGSYKVVFEAGNFTTGIYFYSLYVNGIPLDTKKLILLK